MSGRPAITDHPVHPIIAERWSARAIDPDRPVEREKVLSMLEAARWAPSCFGDQPWRYLVWDRFEDSEAWEQAAANLAEGNQAWARPSPILILAVAATTFSRNGKPNRWGQYDTGAATENLHLQGVKLGLVVHQMGGFDPDAARSLFGIPDDFEPMAMIAVGYPGQVADLPEGYQDSESAPRQRKPLAELAFRGSWDTPLT